MKKRDLTALALIGISAGLVIGCQQQNAPKRNGGNVPPREAPGAPGARNPNALNADEEKVSADMQDFYNTLAPDSQKKFQKLDTAHRRMVVDMTQNSCAGEGGCKGRNESEKGKALSPNRAVEVQYNNQTKGTGSSLNTGVNTNRP